MNKVRFVLLLSFILSSPWVFARVNTSAGDGSEILQEKTKEEALQELKEKGDNGEDPSQPPQFGLLKPGEKDPIPKVPPQDQIPESLVSLGEGEYFSPYAFLVDKEARTLSIWRNRQGIPQFISAFPTDMGRVNGDKNVLGDKKTPEGVYFFQHKYEGRYLDFDEYGLRAFTMDYPNFFDKMEKKTGSGIWLHAIPEKKSLRRGSRGCLVVRNDVIMAVSDFIRLKKTPIIVQNEVNWLPRPKLQTKKQKVINWLKKWKAAWESKNVDKYIQYYHPEFKANKMNRSQWHNYKKQLNQKYRYINVQVNRPTAYKHEDKWVIRFLQGYDSDKITDYGEKFLYIKENNKGALKIVGEVWKPIRRELIATLFNERQPSPPDSNF